MDPFFNTAPASTGLTITNGVGDLTVAGTSSDGSPSIFHAAGSAGLNIWSFTADAPAFTAGQVAFTGSGTWTIDAASYADMVGGNTSGDIYSPADSDDDIPGATYIGTYRVVPAPGSVALLGLGGLAATRRRRESAHRPTNLTSNSTGSQKWEPVPLIPSPRSQS